MILITDMIRERDGFVARDPLLEELGVEWAGFVDSERRKSASREVAEKYGPTYDPIDESDGVERVCPEFAGAMRRWAAHGDTDTSESTSSTPDAEEESLVIKLERPIRGPVQDRFDVDSVYARVPERHRRNKGASGLSNAKTNIRKTIGDDLSGTGAPLARFDEVWAAITSTIPRDSVRVDDSDLVRSIEQVGAVPSGVSAMQCGNPPAESATTLATGSVVDATPAHVTYQQVMDAIRRVPQGREYAGYGSVYDVIQLITGKDRNRSGEVWRDYLARNEDHEQDHDGSVNLTEWKKLPTVKFPGRGQRDTPIAPLKTLLQIVQIIPGKAAAQFRVHCAELLCRAFDSVSIDEAENVQINTTPNRVASTPSLSYQQVMSAIRRVPQGREYAGYGSVIDTIKLVSGKSRGESAEVWRRFLKTADGDEHSICSSEFENLPKYKFEGERQRDTPVANLKTLLQIVQVIPGKAALKFRLHCAELLCRVFAGDPNLKVELDDNFRAMTPENRRDLLLEVPGAAPVVIDDQVAIAKLKNNGTPHRVTSLHYSWLQLDLHLLNVCPHPGSACDDNRLAAPPPTSPLARG